jgi:hypothetical protein
MSEDPEDVEDMEDDVDVDVEEPAPPPPPLPENLQRLHFLIPASKPNPHFCYNLAAAAANRYPAPVILGWNGTGDFDAAHTHLAKLRAINRYLQNLEEADDDDLVLIVDGYDVLMQLPPEILIERYFQVVDQHDGRISRRLGISIEETRKRGIRDTVFWGPDKWCWPTDYAAARCWAVPDSPLPRDAHGPMTGSGDMEFNNPKWLNSGTTLGPVKDVRVLLAASMEEIQRTYNPKFEQKESDQLYIANIWGRQEYFRSLDASHGEPVGGGPPDRRVPVRKEGENVEFHTALDYESSMFFLRAANEPFYDYIPFDHSGLNARMNKDMFGEGQHFVPFDIPMPANVMFALTRLYDSIPDLHAGKTANEWIRKVRLGVGFVTKSIFPLWHCTGPKDVIDPEYTKMWFYPYARSLIKATVRAFQGGELITAHNVAGRTWAPKWPYPNTDELSDELGGAWTDYDGLTFVEWESMCGPWAPILFGGEEPELLPPPPPPAPVAPPPPPGGDREGAPNPADEGAPKPADEGVPAPPVVDEGAPAPENAEEPKEALEEIEVQVETTNERP